MRRDRFKTFGEVALMAHLAHNYPAEGPALIVKFFKEHARK